MDLVSVASPRIRRLCEETRESVQLALSLVINALATGQLETKRATALLYGLQLASMNAARPSTRPYAPEVVRSFEPSAEGLDLAKPGAVLEIPEFEDDEDDEDDYEDDLLEA